VIPNKQVPKKALESDIYLKLWDPRLPKEILGIKMRTITSFLSCAPHEKSICNLHPHRYGPQPTHPSTHPPTHPQSQVQRALGFSKACKERGIK